MKRMFNMDTLLESGPAVNAMRQQVGQYRITGQLGEGGMGVVYRARDERLGREVALKMIHSRAVDEHARQRFWREARAAASLSHPAICQIHEIGEDDGELFIAMELLEGETLAGRITRGALSLADAVAVGLAVLGALGALHRRGLAHRDLKPPNIFLTPHGVKLLDFGLARSTAPAVEQTDVALTLPGTIMGTPRYMAPEIMLGRACDPRADLFAVGAMLFEMLTAQPPFGGATVPEIVHAVAYEEPPVLAGSPAVAAVDRVIHRALAKSPDDRYANADAMAQELRTALTLTDSGDVLRVRPMRRLIVLPFRVLRADPDIDFLSFSLADAITTSLSGLESLVVRSSHAAARFAAGPPDLKAIAAETSVDIVLVGTLLRAGDQLRVTTQLLEAPDGTVIWSHTAQVLFGNIFQLQDDLARRIVSSLSLPLTAREHRVLRHDVPASAKAYEFYLRANLVASDSQTWSLARDLYLQCVDEDPHYAPAWARLGRIYWVLAKYGRAEEDENLKRAESAFTRALEINPDLSIAHNLYAYLEVDLGRARDAMLRLVDRARQRSRDPELFAGLVHACRYCGLLDASSAAYEQAIRLDPKISTSVGHTFFMLGQYEKVFTTNVESSPFIRNIALGMLGREGEAVTDLKAAVARVQTRLHDFLAGTLALYEGHTDASADAMHRVLTSDFKDPEGLFYVARHLAYLGQTDDALSALARAASGGFHCYPTLVRDPWLDPVRALPKFAQTLREVEARNREARAAFLAAGGDKVLGLPTAL
jgi:serine/threonine protein kinase/tetratricopeptide (TPR) repeat protein